MKGIIMSIKKKQFKISSKMANHLLLSIIKRNLSKSLRASSLRKKKMVNSQG